MILAVDISGSADFGSGEQSTRERAAEVAATLAVSALKAGDKVGLLLFSDAAECWVPARKGRRHVLRIVRDILLYPAKSRKTAFAKPLRRLARAVKRRSAIFVISDFLAGSEGPEAMVTALSELNARHDVSCMHLVDARTRTLPDAGILALEDAETGIITEVNTSSAIVREKFAQLSQQRLMETEASLTRAGVDTTRLEQSTAIAPALSRFFERRRKRR